MHENDGKTPAGNKTLKKFISKKNMSMKHIGKTFAPQKGLSKPHLNKELQACIAALKDANHLSTQQKLHINVMFEYVKNNMGTLNDKEALKALNVAKKMHQILVDPNPKQNEIDWLAKTSDYYYKNPTLTVQNFLSQLPDSEEIKVAKKGQEKIFKASTDNEGEETSSGEETSDEGETPEELKPNDNKKVEDVVVDANQMNEEHKKPEEPVKNGVAEVDGEEVVDLLKKKDLENLEEPINPQGFDDITEKVEQEQKAAADKERLAREEAVKEKEELRDSLAKVDNPLNIEEQAPKVDTLENTTGETSETTQQPDQQIINIDDKKPEPKDEPERELDIEKENKSDPLSITDKRENIIKHLQNWLAKPDSEVKKPIELTLSDDKTLSEDQKHILNVVGGSEYDPFRFIVTLFMGGTKVSTMDDVRHEVNEIAKGIANKKDLMDIVIKAKPGGVPVKDTNALALYNPKLYQQVKAERDLEKQQKDTKDLEIERKKEPKDSMKDAAKNQVLKLQPKGQKTVLKVQDENQPENTSTGGMGMRRGTVNN